MGNTIEGKDLKKFLENIENLESFHEQFNYQNNDRSIVIVGLAYIEDLLTYCLESFFPNNSSTVDNLLSHKGGLGTFFSKVEMLYCLGFINKIIKSDLERLALIRNLFAHKISISFEDEKVKQNCFLFKWHETAMMMPAPKEATALEIFKVEVNTMVSYLSGVVSICRGERRKLKKDF